MRGQIAVAVNIREQAEVGAWDRYAQAHPDFTIYHATAFRDAAVEALGTESHGLHATDGSDRIIGVLPLLRQRSRLFGDRLVSLPYCNHGGPLADDENAAGALLEAASRLAGDLGCDRLEIRDHAPRALDWPVNTDKVRMTLDLPGSTEALDRALGAKLRSQCRRALKDGALVQHGGPELIPAFHEVFAIGMRNLGTPVYPRRWFEVLARHLGDHMRFVLVTLHGRPAASGVLIRWRDTMEIPWAASVQEFNRYSVNMLLYHAALELAIEHNCARFDFGRSTRGSGTWRFKRQWSAVESPIHWRVRPASNGPGRISHLLQRAWTRLPLPIANRLGPVISPGLPW